MNMPHPELLCNIYLSSRDHLRIFPQVQASQIRTAVVFNNYTLCPSLRYFRKFYTSLVPRSMSGRNNLCKNLVSYNIVPQYCDLTIFEFSQNVSCCSVSNKSVTYLFTSSLNESSFEHLACFTKTKTNKKQYFSFVANLVLQFICIVTYPIIFKPIFQILCISKISKYYLDTI